MESPKITESVNAQLEELEDADPVEAPDLAASLADALEAGLDDDR